jgi:hypothetical protein
MSTINATKIIIEYFDTTHSKLSRMNTESTQNTISSEYLEQQKILHLNPSYGIASLSFAPIVADLIKQISARSVSDYGAGKKNLLLGLAQNEVSDIEYFPYDPVFPEYGPPKIADLVCCIDVLEHIEPELIDNVFFELAKITLNFGFFSIHMGPAGKILPDGRNAHLIQKPTSWWLPKISEHFDVLHLQSHQMMGNGVWMIVKPKSN